MRRRGSRERGADRTARTSPSVEILVGKGVSGFFAFPVDGHNPPAAAVVQELKAIDAAREGLFALGVTRFVSAPDVSDAVPDLDAIGDRVLTKALFRTLISTPLAVSAGSRRPRHSFSTLF